MRLIYITIAIALTLPVAAQRKRIDNAPKVGDPIPKVSAVAMRDKKDVDLSKPDKVTVLIFGSHT